MVHLPERSKQAKLPNRTRLAAVLAAMVGFPQFKESYTMLWHSSKDFVYILLMLCVFILFLLSIQQSHTVLSMFVDNLV